MQLAQYFRTGRPVPEIGPLTNHNDWLDLVWPIVFLIVVLAGLYFAYRIFGNKQAMPIDPLDVAKERYARGEITKEELADIRKELKD